LSKNIDGTYGSGRFCNKQCACAFSTKEKRSEINHKVSLCLHGRKGNNGNGFKKNYDSNRHPLSDEDRKKAKIGFLKYQTDYVSNTPFPFLSKLTRKRILIEERGHKCENCKSETWMTCPIPLEVDHVDGNNKNNMIENCKLLCPNCHALTPTYRGKNINAKRKITDDEFKTALVTAGNIRQALLTLHLTPCGGNYERAKRLAFEGLNTTF
jgi:hypothetical protein